jgi:hypothetical protein
MQTPFTLFRLRQGAHGTTAPAPKLLHIQGDALVVRIPGSGIDAAWLARTLEEGNHPRQSRGMVTSSRTPLTFRRPALSRVGLTVCSGSRDRVRSFWIAALRVRTLTERAAGAVTP